MQRRTFLMLSGAAALWPGSLLAQPKPARVGVLLYNTFEGDPNVEAFQRGMRELGYIPGQNVAYEYRAGEGRPERLPQLAAELVQLKPDIIYVLGGDVAPHVVKATQSIPIVFSVSADPVRAGLVATLSRPGGNATGFTYLHDETASKRLGLLLEAVPGVSRVAFLYNPDHIDNELGEAERAAAARGVTLQLAETRGSNDLASALEQAKAAKVDAIYVVSSRQTVANLARIVEFANANRLPLIGGWGAWAQSGALMSYGPNVSEVVRQSAAYVHKVLRGEKPAELPVQQPTRFELLVNMKTVKLLGIAVPEQFLLRADRLIE